MSWKRNRPKIFEKVWLTRHDPYLRVQVAIYYQPPASYQEEKFYAELDGKTVVGKTPSAVKERLPELVEVAYSYSDWAFYLKVKEDGRADHAYHDQSGTYSAGQTLDLDYQLLLLGKRSDGKRVQAPCHLSADLVPHVGPAIQHPRGKTGPCCKGSGTDFAQIDVTTVTEHYRESWEKGAEPGIVPFTPARLAWMRRLQTAVSRVRGEIDKILDGGGTALAKRLDAAVATQSGIPLLPPAAASEKDDDEEEKNRG